MSWTCPGKGVEPKPQPEKAAEGRYTVGDDVRTVTGDISNFRAKGGGGRARVQDVRLWTQVREHTTTIPRNIFISQARLSE
jgi:hypothetical protein